MKMKCLALVAILSIGIAPMSGEADDASAISKWIGRYDSVTGNCGVLVVEESKITWAGCRGAATKLISVSNSKLAVEVDSSAKRCEWAGFVVALRNVDGHLIKIAAYQDRAAYKADNRYVQCTFTKG
jgi:hypothetical protein